MSKVGVVDAAYRYICDLQAALVHKLATRGVPTDLRGESGGVNAVRGFGGVCG